MNDRSYEAIVIGLGAIGSATAAHLAERGVRVLGLDMYPPAHNLGSSHGGSRIIREAYFEAPDYVPLVQRSYEQWRQLEAVTNRDLLRITGGVCFGAPDETLVLGAQRSAEIHHLPYERLSPREVTRRFPGFSLPEDMIAIYEPRAGILDPEGGVAAHLQVAAACGADLHYEEPVLRWSADGAGVRVETAAGSYSAGHLVIAAGPWAGQVLEDLHLPLEVQRIVNVYFEPERLDNFTPDQCPIYLFHGPEGWYYGFPYLEGQGLKAGRHDGGEVCTPQTIRRAVEEGEITMLRDALNHYLPGSAGRCPQSGYLYVYDDTRRAFHPRPPPCPPTGGLRRRFLRPWLQVRPGDRRDPGGPGTGRQH